MPFAVLALEAAIIVHLLVPSQVVSPADEKKCLLLREGLCSVYEQRPIICRTQGLPLGYIDEEAGTIEVSACELNFTQSYPFTHDDLLFMDTFNRRLAGLNQQYCCSAGLRPERRIPISDLISR